MRAVTSRDADTRTSVVLPRVAAPSGRYVGRMRVILTLMVRDEADIIDSHLDYHLHAGVDFVIVTDHRSRDGTTEILESYARAGQLRIIREDGEFAQQAAWQMRMARIAASEHGADWVIPSDADEFWWPRGSSLDQALAEVPSEYGIVRGLLRNFVPIRDDNGQFAERLTVRLAGHAPINDPATPFRSVVKVAHRADPGVFMGKGGGHQVFGLQGAELRAWHPVEVLHFPLRSREQCARKYRKTWTGWERNLRGDLARARQSSEQGRPDDMWDRVSLEDADLDRGLGAGSLVSDTRLRDRLTALRRDNDGDPPFLIPSISDTDAHALGVAVFEEAEVVRLQRWADSIEQRIARFEETTR